MDVRNVGFVRDDSDFQGKEISHVLLTLFGQY